MVVGLSVTLAVFVILSLLFYAGWCGADGRRGLHKRCYDAEQKKAKSWEDVANARLHALEDCANDIQRANVKVGRLRDENGLLKRLYREAYAERKEYRDRLSATLAAVRRAGLIAVGQLDTRELPVQVRKPLRIMRESAEKLMMAASHLPAEPARSAADKPSGWAARPYTYTNTTAPAAADIIAASKAMASAVNEARREYADKFEQDMLFRMMRDAGPKLPNFPMFTAVQG